MGGASDAQFGLAHSLLISRYTYPRIPVFDGNVRQIEDWTAALKETPESAINRFKNQGLLVPFVPSNEDEVREGLGQVCGVLQLRSMLRARGLKVSGSKPELTSRLLASGWKQIADDLSKLGLYSCSDGGKRLAASFEQRKRQAYLAAVSAISGHQVEEAIHQYQRLEDELGFPRWVTPAGAKLIELIMTVKPAILGGCSEGALSRLDRKSVV